VRSRRREKEGAERVGGGEGENEVRLRQREWGRNELGFLTSCLIYRGVLTGLRWATASWSGLGHNLPKRASKATRLRK
jgi:hypothetical protein